MRSSLREVAKAAGVSPSTASRALSGHHQVSEETRRRVLEAAKALGYDPGRARKGKNGPASRILALIVPDVSSPFYCAILEGVEAEAFSRGYDLVLYTTRGRSRENVVQRLLEMRHSGLVVVTPRHEEDKMLRDLGGDPPVNAVIVDHRSEGTKFPHVTVDNLRAALQATGYLVSRGHRRIGFITGPLEIESARDRLRGYRLALEEAGIGFDEGLVLSGDFQQPTGYRLIKEWIKQGKPMPDAWFCSNDLMAAGVLQALAEAGISVPEDVAVMGFDDLPLAQHTRPPLTTVRQPIREMGQTAIRMLLRLIEGKPLEARRVVLDTEIMVRGSA